MTRATTARLAGVTLAMLALTACSDDEPTAPSGADAAYINSDVAATTGAAIASDVAVWKGNEASVAPGFGAAGVAGSGNCTVSGNTTTCSGGSEGTLTVTRTITFADASGASQQAYDAATTASIRFAVQVNGSMNGPQLSSTISRTRDLTVSGLAGAETQRRWNGTGAATVRSTYTSTDLTRRHELTEADTTTNVTWVVSPRAAWPASGSVVRHLVVNTSFSGSRSGSFRAFRRVRVTFNGTPNVPLEVSAVTRTGSTVQLQCSLNLETRVVGCLEGN